MQPASVLTWLLLPFILHRQWWCKTPQKAMGWVAAPFFVSFIILSSLVVLNLFIGVIISNMNDARATLEKVTLQLITVGNANDV